MNLQGTFILAAVVLSQHSQSAIHRVPIEKLVAGYSIEKGGHVVARDKKSGFYLIRYGE